jgi:hypothetical protein
MEGFDMKHFLGLTLAGLALAGLGAATGARAAELPKATEALLEELKTDASVLAGLDQELARAPGLDRRGAQGG